MTTTDDEIAYQLAGIDIDAPTSGPPAATWLAPEEDRVWCNGDALACVAVPQELHAVTADDQVLRRFLRVASDGPGAVLAVAKRYGPLAASAGLRSTLALRSMAPLSLSRVDFTKLRTSRGRAGIARRARGPDGLYGRLAERDREILAGRHTRLLRHVLADWAPDAGRVHVESIAGWIRFANYVRTILRIASQLHQGLPGDAADWEQMEFVERVEPPYIDPSIDWARWELDESESKVRGDHTIQWASQPIESQQSWLAVHVERLTRDAEPRLRFAWEQGERPSVTVQGTGLYSAIVMQLISSVARAEEWEVCSGCGDWFIPTYRARRGTRRYCDKPECKRASLRHAQRDKRAREKSPVPQTPAEPRGPD